MSLSLRVVIKLVTGRLDLICYIRHQTSIINKKTQNTENKMTKKRSGKRVNISWNQSHNLLILGKGFYPTKFGIKTELEFAPFPAFILFSAPSCSIVYPGFFLYYFSYVFSSFYLFCFCFFIAEHTALILSLIHIWRCRRRG